MTSRLREFLRSDSFKLPLLAYVVARVIASCAAILTAGATKTPDIAPEVVGYIKPVYSRVGQLLVGIWERNDTLWYLHIARDGYNPASNDAVFFPLYPLLIRAVHEVTGFSLMVSALGVSQFFTLAALILLFQLTRLELDESTARRAIWYQALFPGSIYLFAAYTEPLFLALALASFLCARKGHWLGAGIAACFLGLTRNSGILLIPTLCVEWIQQRKNGEARLLDMAWFGAISPLGFIAYVAYNYFSRGDALAFVHLQSSGWQRFSSWPWETAWLGLSQAFSFASTYPGAIYVLEAGALLFALALTAVVFRGLRLSYAVFTLLAILLPLCSTYQGRALMSYMRFESVWFPLFMALASLTRRDSADHSIRAVFAVLFGLCVLLFLGGHYLF